MQSIVPEYKVSLRSSMKYNTDNQKYIISVTQEYKLSRQYSAKIQNMISRTHYSPTTTLILTHGDVNILAYQDISKGIFEIVYS